MNPHDFIWWVFVPWFLVIFISLIVWLMRKSWNIPVVILRFTGDKRRPSLVVTKGKKKRRNGVTFLMVRGYDRAFRDFLAENYYPSLATKFGGLILFEFEDGWLTPLRPSWKRLTPEARAECEAALRRIQGMRDVTFDYDKAIHDQLKLQIVDDVDADFYLQQLSRIDSQYSGPWGWLKEHAGTLITAMALILIFVGFIMWMKEDPANSAQRCISAMGEVCRGAINVTVNDPNLLQNIAGRITGVPPG